MAILISALLFVITTLISIYFYLRWKFTYWERKGIPNVKPAKPWNILDFMGKHHTKWTEEFYYQFKGKSSIGGVYLGTSPLIIPVDLELIKNILIKDFNSFHDRGTYFNERDDPLTAHLFNIEGQKWRTLRSKLSPTFTSGKMKFMFPTIVEVSERFVETLDKILEDDAEIEVKELLARFTTDIIGSCAFGIECNSLNDPNAEFRRMGKIVFEEPNLFRLMKFLFAMSFKGLARSLRLRTMPQNVNDFFIGIVKETVEMRESKKIHRNDFMDLLIELKNGEEGLSINEIAAQAFVFFAAGFETSSTTMTFCLYELALHQEYQNKAREEVNRILGKYNGELTYEAMMDMQYLDMLINETLRKYPPVGNLFRKANEDYKVQKSDFVIEKGVGVWIPIYAIQHDPEIYPDPDKFNPERFTPEEVKARHSSSYLSFGDGPRNCVGLRFGMMQSRIGLIQLLKHFRFSVCKGTKVPLEIAAKSFILSPEGGMFLKIEKLESLAQS